MTRYKQLAVVGIIALIAFIAGALFGGRNELQATLLLSGPEDPPEGIDMDPVWKAWRLLEEKYVPATTTDPLSKQDRVWGIIDGLAASYGDPYTVFFPPKKSENFAEDISGAFGGVGVEIGMREGILTVIAPLKDTPGDKAGILPKDLIIEVDGVSTASMSIDEAVDAIRGEAGTEVVLTIAREGEREFLTIPVVRSVIEVPTLDGELREDGVFVLSLYNFGGTAEREVRDALRTFLKSGSTRLLIDLRGNPGGYLDVAVDIASWFLPVGTVVVTEDYGDDIPPRVHRSGGTNVMRSDWRMAILVDEGSASASEILAGALREHGKAVLVGEKTYGKGSVQELVELTPDTSLKITVARWLTPHGVSISENGLEPDLTVPLTIDDIEAERDPQLDAAVHYLLSGELVAPEPPAEKAEEVEIE